MVRACAAFAFIRHHRMRIWVRQFDALVSSASHAGGQMSDEIDNPEVMGDADAADDGIHLVDPNQSCLRLRRRSVNFRRA